MTFPSGRHELMAWELQLMIPKGQIHSNCSDLMLQRIFQVQCETCLSTIWVHFVIPKIKFRRSENSYVRNPKSWAAAH